MPGPDSGPRSAALFRYLPAVGLFVYLAVVWFIGWEKIRDEIVNADVSKIAWAFGLTWLATWCRAWKWRIALGPDRFAVALFFLSKAAGNWSPGRVGEFSPLAWKRHRNARVAAWIACDRLLEIVVTLALGVTGLWLMTLVPRSMALFASAGVAVAIAAALWLLTRRAVLLRAARRFGVRTRIRAALRALAAVSREVRHFKRTLLPTAAITVVMKAIDLVAVVLLFSALGAHPGFWIVAASKCALAIVSFLPVTPPATLIPHGVQAWILHEEAGVAYEILAAVIGIEVVMISVTFWTSFGLAAGGLRRALGAETPNPMKLS